MEPLDPEIKRRLLAGDPPADPGDIEEFERLLAEMFITDPDLPKSPDDMESEVKKKLRLEDLQKKLFKGKSESDFMKTSDGYS